MENGTEKNTQLLEACRFEMDKLASEGENVLRNAVAQAERQVKTCTAEWKQAQKTVALTTAQHETVAEARATGQEKLAGAISEEADARIAAETVQRMIEDAHTLNCMANTDTARILQKAGNVLDETAKRAADFYQEKKLQREEVEAALCRLDATEKAVLYTVAKAERRASEKMLLKLIAERRQEVCTAEFECIRTEQRRDDLLTQKEAVSTAIDELHDALHQAKLDAEAREAASARLQHDMSENMAAVESESAESLNSLADQITTAEQEKRRLNDGVLDAETFYAECEAEYETAARLAEEAKRDSADVALNAQHEQDTAIHELEEKLSGLRQESETRREAYSDVLAQREAAEAERMRLQQVAEQYHKKAEDARAEQQSAQDAAQTAYRLAENATKIRESISSESSELLMHAQQVLMEAASAAQKLKEEKELLRKSAEQECALMLERVEHASQTLERVCRHVDEADAACQEIERQIVDEAARLERERQEWAAKTAAMIDQAERACEQTAHSAEEKRQVAAEALAELDKLRAQLQRAEENLLALAQEKEDVSKRREEKLLAIQRQVEGEMQRLAADNAAAEVSTQQLQDEYAARQEMLAALNSEIEQTSDLLREMAAHVDEIIAVGVLDIISAEEVVGGSRYKEETARRAAEEVVSYLGAYQSGADRFVSLQGEDDADAADMLEEEPPVVDWNGDAAQDTAKLFTWPQEAEDSAVAEAAAADDETAAAPDELAVAAEAVSVAAVAGDDDLTDEPAAEEDAPATSVPAAEEEMWADTAAVEEGLLQEETAAAETEQPAEDGSLYEETSLAADAMLTQDEIPAEDAMPADEGMIPEEGILPDEEILPAAEMGQEEENLQEEGVLPEEEPLFTTEECPVEELPEEGNVVEDVQPAEEEMQSDVAEVLTEEVLTEEAPTETSEEEVPFSYTELLAEVDNDSAMEEHPATGSEETDADYETAATASEAEDMAADEEETGLLADEDVILPEDADDEELPDLFGGLMPEEIEYTQRLAKLGDTLINQVLEQDEDVKPAQPVETAKEDCSDWMANLTRSLSDEEDTAATAEQEPVINSAPLLHDDMQEIQEVLLQTNEPKTAEDEIDEDELRLSILNVMDEPPQTPPKKRRFPFF